MPKPCHNPGVRKIVRPSRNANRDGKQDGGPPRRRGMLSMRAERGLANPGKACAQTGQQKIVIHDRPVAELDYMQPLVADLAHMRNFRSIITTIAIKDGTG
jgi:hypothetical protein